MKHTQEQSANVTKAKKAATDTTAETKELQYPKLIYKPLEGEFEGRFAIIHPESKEELGMVDGPIKPLIDACYDLYMRTSALVDKKDQQELSKSKLKDLLKSDYNAAVTNILYHVALKSFNGFKAVVGNQSLSGALEGKRQIDDVKELLSLLGDDNVPTRLSENNAAIASVFATAFAEVSNQLEGLRSNYVDQNTRIFKVVKPIIKSVLDSNSNFTGQLADAFRTAVSHFENNVQGVEVIAAKMPKLIHQLEAQMQTLDTEVSKLEEINSEAEKLDAQLAKSGQRRNFTIQLKELADSAYLPQHQKKQINIFYNELTALYKEEQLKEAQKHVDEHKEGAEAKKPNALDKLKAVGKKVKNAVVPKKVQKATNPNNAKIDEALLKFKGKTLAVLKTRQADLEEARGSTLKSLNSAKRNPFKQLYNLFFKLFRAIQNAMQKAREKRAVRKDAKMHKAQGKKAKVDFKKSPQNYVKAQQFFGKDNVKVKAAVEIGANNVSSETKTEDKKVADPKAEHAVTVKM